MVLKSRSLNILGPSGPVQACNWIALLFNCTAYVLTLSSLLHDLFLTFILLYLPYLFLLNILRLLHVLFPFPLSLRHVKRLCDADSRRQSTEATQAFDTTARYRHMGSTKISKKRGGGHNHKFAYVVLCQAFKNKFTNSLGKLLVLPYSG
jgi:hypothetical protein